MTLYIDDFDRIVPSGLGSIPNGPLWEIVGDAKWSILENDYPGPHVYRGGMTPPLPTYGIAVVSVGRGNAVVSISTKTESVGFVVYARVVDKNNYIKFKQDGFIDNITYTLSKMVNGVSTTLDSVYLKKYPVNAHLTLRVEGTSVKAYSTDLSPNPILTATVSEGLYCDRHGWGADYTNTGHVFGVFDFSIDSLNSPPSAPILQVPPFIDARVSNRIVVPYVDPDAYDPQSRIDIKWWDLTSTGARKELPDYSYDDMIAAVHFYTQPNVNPFWDSPANTFTPGKKEMQAWSYDSTKDNSKSPASSLVRFEAISMALKTSQDFVPVSRYVLVDGAWIDTRTSAF